MTRIYTAYGTPMDIAKREAKRLHKERGIKLSEAQQAYAMENGYESFGELVSKSIEVDDETVDTLIFKRRSGTDIIWYRIDDDAIEDIMEKEQMENFGLRVIRGLEVGPEEGSVRHIFSLVSELDVSPDYSEPFELRGGATGETWEDAIIELQQGRFSPIISLLNTSGLLDIQPDRPPHEFEHEAALVLEMRKRGLLVGDRILFNTGDNKAQGEPDFDRRCFANLLSDGDVVLTNAAATYDELIWRVLPRAEYEAVKAEMEAVLGDLAYTTYQGEAWMFDRVLASAAAETAPDTAPC